MRDLLQELVDLFDNPNTIVATAMKMHSLYNRAKRLIRKHDATS